MLTIRDSWCQGLNTMNFIFDLRINLSYYKQKSEQTVGGIIKVHRPTILVLPPDDESHYGHRLFLFHRYLIGIFS